MANITTKYPFVGSIETRQGGRFENQDSAGFIDTPLGLLLVVCDGMGGGPGGRTASLMAVDSILSMLSDVSVQTRREDALKFAIEKANDIIYTKAKETPELRGMGTTIVAILINEESAVIAHAGDSRIYQLRKGTIIFRSSDHSVVANLVRQNKITEEEARNHPQLNVVTRALGIRPRMDIEFDEVTFLRGDRFVLCTDGIWGMMPQCDLIKHLSQVMGINELTSSMTELIDRMGHANGGGHDNLTIAVVDTTFDSVKKKIKKKGNREAKDEVYKKETIVSKLKNNSILKKLGIFFTIVILVIIFIILNKRQFENKQVKRKLQGITTTTIEQVKPKIKKKDYVNSENNDIDLDRKVTKQNERVVNNPFQDSISRNLNISYQINSVIKNLDSLIHITEKKRDRSMSKKLDFVKKVIRPNIKQLKTKVNAENQNEIDEIIRLLDDSKTISCDKSGYSTKDSKKHIEIIKTKVRGLQN